MKNANYNNAVVLLPTIVSTELKDVFSSVSYKPTDRMNQCNLFTTSSIVLLVSNLGEDSTLQTVSTTFYNLYHFKSLFFLTKNYYHKTIKQGNIASH